MNHGSAQPPSHHISARLFQDGLTVKEIAKERNMSTLTIQDHIIRYGIEGNDIDWSVIIPIEQETVILAKVNELGAEKLKPLKEALPEEIDYFTIKAVIAKRTLA